MKLEDKWVDFFLKKITPKKVTHTYSDKCSMLSFKHNVSYKAQYMSYNIESS